MSTTEFIESCSFAGTTVDHPKLVENPMEVLSDFGDATCGEPEFAQHLMLDFTPDPEIDNEIVQTKICDFWNFINDMPEIQNLKVKPTKCEKPAKSSNASVRPDLLKTTQPQQQTEENLVDMTKTACSMLEVVGEKELITRAFEVSMAHTVCSLGSFKEEEHIQQNKRLLCGHIICKCVKPCKACPAKKQRPSSLKQLCTKLEQWDDKHPKSMEPPGHSPILQHCILQKQVFEF